jgi:hypothetical protein
MGFQPRKRSLRDLAQKLGEQGPKPLYAGVTYKPSYSTRGDPIKIALPRVRWLDRK